MSETEKVVTDLVVALRSVERLLAHKAADLRERP
jgi:hypothetical protein